ncbi:MAG: glycosyl hydrolase-related protein [Silicimonas sp.]|nr:glycosyl hydrolase-related protein [Silicimonas sp.]
MPSGDHARRFTREKIASRLALIAPMVFRRRAPLEVFRFHPLAETVLEPQTCGEGVPVAPGAYWGGADQDFVLRSGFTVPEGWEASKMALHLPLGVLGDIFNHPEALVHVDDMPIGSADRYHHTLPLVSEVADGQRHELRLHGWTGHAGWPPDPSSRAKLQMGDCALVERDPETEAFHTLASAALDALSVVEDAGLVDRILTALDEAFLRLDTRDPLGAAFYASVPGALACLRDGLDRAGAPMEVTMHAIGHAHMDIAYLWPIAQIRLKNARTYSNVLRLMEEEPDYCFSHSQPALYEMTARDHPALFAQIKARVAEARWEVMGGMWVEPDLNLAGPEALIRQLMLGRGYFREMFGDVETPVLWLPDSFGFPGQIPQLMKLAGLEWFVTNKLNWNQINRVPWATHLWEGIDGTRVKAHVLTTPREVQYLPFPTNYKSDLSAGEVMGTWTHAGEGAATALPICFGYGDGGGGPTEDLLAKARIWGDFPGMPRVKMARVSEALAALEDAVEDWPVWRGEHYLEGHRGVYTSQGWIKRANRSAEVALHQAEALAAMAGQGADLVQAWKLLCLNQFHDFITGTSVPSVFEEARADYARIGEMAEAVADRAALALAGPEAQVASMLPTHGARVVEVEGDDGGQRVEGGGLLFFEALVPYSLTPLSAAVIPAIPVTMREEGGRITLENAHLSAVFEAGVLVALWERGTGRAVLAEGAVGNQLLAFEDRPICWDAWDIDPHYEDREEAFGAPQSVEIVERGPLRAKLRLTFDWCHSRLVQEVVLAADSRRLDFQTEVEWHESHVLLKVAFPLSVTAPEALFDIQWGRIARSTGRSSDFDAARFEVPAQKWAALADDRLEVALMNDCKYGYDLRENTLRLTLIKSATSPDPGADQGRHLFTYGLYAGPADAPGLRDHAAYDLNRPARVIPAGEGRGQAGFDWHLSAENVLIETVKPGAAPGSVVLRLFEAAGRPVRCDLSVPARFQNAWRTDIFERCKTPLDLGAGRVALELGRFEIVTLLLA